MSDAVTLDSGWIAANPVPVHGGGTDKNSRGRVLVVGGSAGVPGALRLTGEAALRVGAGKLQMATIAAAAAMLGLLVPEAGVIALPADDDGEIAADAVPKVTKALGNADVAVIGPGMAEAGVAARLLRRVLGDPGDAVLLLDAAAVCCAEEVRDVLAPWRGRLVMTPHHGEMAQLTGMDSDAIAADAAGVATRIAAEFGAVVALKGTATVIAGPDGALIDYPGGGVGLATGGSGDVLAGAIAGLMSRGASPLVATAWGVWLHGEAGKRMASRPGPIGFLGRELSAEFPHLLPQ